MGPGCITIEVDGNRRSRESFIPQRALNSDSDGKNPLVILSFWTRRVMTTSGCVSIASSRVETTVAPQPSISRGSRVWGAARVTVAPSVRSSTALLRATRECRMSPTITTAIPDRSMPRAVSPRSRVRIVKASRRACVGCSCVPSPALMMCASTQPLFVTVEATPECECRSTMKSAPIASSVCSVSLRLSPLETLDPCEVNVVTSALSASAAASNDSRVLVLSSKNTFATVLPRSVGSFFTSRDRTSAMSIAVSSIATALSVVRSRVEIRCFTRYSLRPSRRLPQ